MFLVRFTILAAPVYLLLWQNWNPLWLRTVNAKISSSVLNLLRVETSQLQTFIETNTFTVDVSTDSTGWKSFIALTALILSVRGEKIRKKIYGIVLGTALVFLGNIVRLVSMMYMVEKLGIPYELIHKFLWRWGLTFLVLIAWLVWLNWEDVRKKVEQTHLYS